MRIRKSVKICLGVTAFLIIITTAVILILWFTLLKPKQPKLTTQEVTLKHLNLVIIPLHLNATLGLVLGVKNPNHASFKYENTTAFISYRGSPAGEAPIEEDTIPARGDHNISTDLVLSLDSVVANAGFEADLAAGCLNFTSSTELHGRAKVLNLFKIKATTYSTCEISVYIFTNNASSVCSSKYKY